MVSAATTTALTSLGTTLSSRFAVSKHCLLGVLGPSTYSTSSRGVFSMAARHRGVAVPGRVLRTHVRALPWRRRRVVSRWVVGWPLDASSSRTVSLAAYNRRSWRPVVNAAHDILLGYGGFCDGIAVVHTVARAGLSRNRAGPRGPAAAGPGADCQVVTCPLETTLMPVKGPLALLVTMTLVGLATTEGCHDGAADIAVQAANRQAAKIKRWLSSRAKSPSASDASWNKKAKLGGKRRPFTGIFRPNGRSLRAAGTIWRLSGALLPTSV